MKNWQIQLGGWGGVLWLGSFQIMEYANSHGNEVAAKTIVGYTLGFITTFSGYLFWEVIHGRWETFLGNDRGLMRILSSIPLLVIFVIGMIGFLNAIFNSMPWFYNFSFAVAGIVVGQGLVPVINHIDGTQT